MKLLLANPRGFCAGVDRAIEIVERALAAFGSPIYVRHEVVHNHYVVNDLKHKGAVFVDELEQVPDGNIVIFSAHGVSRAVREDADRRRLRVFDATCPLVTKVHLEVAAHARRGSNVVLIGHAGHPEVEGTMGQYQPVDDSVGIFLVENEQDVEDLRLPARAPVAYVTQTTLSVDDTRRIIDRLKARFPEIAGPRKDDICYATQNRQDTVKVLAGHCDLVLVVGSPTSSNSSRLREIAAQAGVAAHLIDRAVDIDREWLRGVSVIGLTAGASAPELLVTEVVEHLRDAGVTEVEEYAGCEENIVFSLPKDLQRAI